MENVILSYSSQIYLNAIYKLEKQNHSVRSVDIANVLHVSKPSVTRAIKILIGLYMIKKNNNGEIIITDSGKETVENMRSRFETVKSFFYKSIGECASFSDKEIIKITNAMSDEVIDAIGAAGMI